MQIIITDHMYVYVICLVKGYILEKQLIIIHCIIYKQYLHCHDNTANIIISRCAQVN